MSENLIKLRLYKYDAEKTNGLGEEIENVMIGSKIISCLDDTLDTAEITINNSARKNPYKPLTKFKVVLEQDNNTTKYYDYELRYDLVEKISMSKDLYTHRLYLGNPAISCQKRTCDNFAISYRLQDVTLESDSFDTTYISNTQIYKNYISSDINNTIWAYSGIRFGEKDTESSKIGRTIYTWEQMSARYYEWQQWDYHSVNGKIDVDTSNSYADKIKKMHYWIILDSDSNGLTTEMQEKMYAWWKKQNTSVKIQVANMQPNKTYLECFEECPLIKYNEGNPSIDYVIPQLVAYTSNTYGANIESGDQSIDKSNFIMIPTTTNVSIVDNESGIAENKTYYSVWSNSKYATHEDNSLGSKSLIDIEQKKSSYIKYRYNTSKQENVICINDYTYNNGGETTTIYNSNLRVVDSGNNNNIVIPTIYVSGGKTYTFETSPYSGGCSSIGFYQDDIQLSEIPSDLLLLKKYINIQWETIYSSELGISYVIDTKERKSDYAQASDFNYKVSFTLLKPNQMISDVILKTGTTKPNCFDLFKKAQICAETKNVSGDKSWNEIESKMLPYVVSSETKNKLTNKELIEDTYQNKNLWEIFMQIGKYIHAKPYITFYNNKYMLNYKDYGISNYSTDKATKNSIYNSNDIENYISSLDSFIQNYFQYGNKVVECIRPTDNDGTCVCSTDNAVLKTKYPILEIISLKFRDFSTTNNSTFDLTDYVYEHNIYKILPLHKTISGTTSGYSHFKGNSVYYHVNSTEIQGFQYKEISTNASTENAYAIKQAMYEVLTNAGDTRFSSASKVKINDFYFIIQYRTKDDVRFKSYKPDLRKFIRNADVDLYPIQSQFNNQLDKTVDSEKYGNNTYGTLLRSGNENKDYQDYVLNIDELKDSGELYDLGNQYYVSRNTMLIYPTYVACETEYSKDFNKLSEIIGIDSQPRFYEIAEDNYIKRNIAIDRFYSLFDNADINKEYKSVKDSQLLSMCYQADSKRPNYAMVYFKSMSGHNTETLNYNRNVIVPCIPYMSGNTITFELDMSDNFGAGDWQKDATEEYKDVYYSSSWFAQMLSIFTNLSLKKNDNTYTTRQSYQYCDVFGKADLMDFRILHENAVDSTTENKTDKYVEFLEMNIPELDTESSYYINGMLPKSMGSETENANLTSKDYGYIIDKDARECIGVNFSCHLLTSSDRFIVSNQFWNEKIKADGTYLDYKTDYYIVYLSKPVDKFTRDEIVQNEILRKSQINLYDFIMNGYNIFRSDGTETGTPIDEEEPSVYADTKAVAIAFSIKENNSQMNFLWALNLGDNHLDDFNRIAIKRVNTSDFKTEYED